MEWRMEQSWLQQHSFIPAFLHGSSPGISAQILKVAELILAKLHLLLLPKGNSVPDPDLHVEGHQQGLEGGEPGSCSGGSSGGFSCLRQAFISQ